MKNTRKTFGVTAIAMLLVGGLIAPAAADSGNTEETPNACQFVEHEYERTVTTEGDKQYFRAGDEREGWKPTGESKNVVTQEYVAEQTDEVTDWFRSSPGTPWTATGASRVDQDATSVTEFEWVNPGGNKKEWSTASPGNNWTKTGLERSEETQPKLESFEYIKTVVTQEEVTEKSHTEFEYVEFNTTTDIKWSASNPGGDWEATAKTRLVDIPDCDLFELSPANPAAGQCDESAGAIKLDTGSDYSSTITVDGVDVDVTVSGTNVTFSDAVDFCVKASNGNSGAQSGTSYDVDFVNRGGNHPDISNVVIYGLVDDTDPKDPEDDTDPKDPAPEDEGTEVGGVVIDKDPEGDKPSTETDDKVVVKVPAKVHAPVHAPVKTTSAPEHAQVLGKVITAEQMPRTGVPALALILMGLTSMGLGTKLISRKRS